MGWETLRRRRCLLLLGAVALGLSACGGAPREARVEGADGVTPSPTGGESGKPGTESPTGSEATRSSSTIAESFGHHRTTQPAGKVAEVRLRGTSSGQLYDAVGRDPEREQPALVPLTGYNQFWFAWSVFNHESAVFRNRDVQTAPIQSSESCQRSEADFVSPGTASAVPCAELGLGCFGKDCIPALTGPTLASGADDTGYLSANSFVVGFSRNGEARAYPHNILWWHEIVNDVVGGEPVAITHCPLTFSSITHDPTQFLPGKTVELGVSGRLYNSNLTFHVRDAEETWYNQLLGVGTVGPHVGSPAPRIASFEMTWAAWQSLFPDTGVLSEDTGHARDYRQYPYGRYFENDADVFRPTNPAPDDLYPAKTLTYGVRLGSAAKAWPHPELAAWASDTYGAAAGPRGVVNDSVAGQQLAVVFDLEAGYVQAFLVDEELALELP